MLKGIPNEDHLARMYHELGARGAACEGAYRPWPYRIQKVEELFCLGADMSRHDPRLFSILVRFMAEQWRSLNPLAIRLLYGSMSTPQTVAVIAEFLIHRKDIDDEEIYFLEYIQQGLVPVSTQFYFHHLYKVGGNMMRRAVEEPLREYKKWGFIAREAPILDDASRQSIGTHDPISRKNILRRLLKGGKPIRLFDYLDAMDNSISRQQALLDLRSISGIACSGKGRAARWKLTA